MQHANHLQEPSDWVRRWAHLVPRGADVLDLASGSGRHARFFSQLGHPVLAVDRDAAALGGLAGVAGVVTRQADLEGAPWPFAERRFGAVVVTNYLFRPLFAHLTAAVAADGVLIYETFAAGNERFGKPSNPDFLLQPGELLERVRGRLRVIAFEDVYVERPKPAMLQRLCACDPQRALAPD
ncbi:MAG: SAM-dependent methyltransferase [Burkholderiales bacterium]